MTRMHRPCPTPCGREQERVARKRTDVHVKHPEAAKEPLAATTFVAAALARSRNVVPMAKSIRIRNLELSFAAQESGALAKRLVVENHAPTSRIVQPMRRARLPNSMLFAIPSRIPYRERGIVIEDLHVHSTMSDGSDTFEQVLEQAAQRASSAWRSRTTTPLPG